MPRSSQPSSSHRNEDVDETADSLSTQTPRAAVRREPSNRPPPSPHHAGVARGRRSSSFSSSSPSNNDNPADDSPMSHSQQGQPHEAASPTDATFVATAPTRPSSSTATLAVGSLASTSSPSSKGRKRPSTENTEGGRAKKHTRVQLEPLQVALQTVSGNIKRKSRRKSEQDTTESTDPAASCSAPAVTPTPTRLELGSVPFDSETKENHDSPSSSSSASSTKSHLSTTYHPVPEGVTQLYPPRRSTAHLHCQCQQNDHCSADSFTSNYVLSYGWDHSQLLRRSESCPDLSLPAPAQRRSSESSSSNHSQGSEAGQSYFSEATPKGGVGWFIPANRNRPPSDNDSSSAATHEGDYMARQPDLTPKMRGILIDWLVELSEEYNLAPASLHLAITLVDKSLASGPLDTDEEEDGPRAGLVISRDMLQCLGCACLWIATKIEEVEPPSLDDFVYISDNTYTRQQITVMEMSVCAALRFRIWQTTPYHFLYEFLRASHACSNPCCLPTSHHHMFRNMVLYLIEIARVPYKLANRPPSLITAAAVYLARATLGMRDASSADATGNGIWTLTLQHYTGYNVDQLRESVCLLHQQHRLAGDASLKQVYTKFLKEKYNQVSLKTALNVEDLGF